ncbi:MAG: threonine synthase [Candidatus Methylacidiphilales bacterium]|nr:threonine synthase [Candidatus Methylacidiphilales bacterium]
MNQPWPGLIEHYRAYLPVTDKTPVVTLLEGNTPLIPVPRLAAAIGADVTLYLKYEALNPTCSFKDRGMTLAMSVAKERGARVVACASTGNTSAAAAAYAARAGMKAVVVLPHGNIAMGKLAQALIYGAQIIPITGNFDDALNLVRELGKLEHFEVVNSINPVRIEGQKTAAFEICDVLGRAPDYHFIPVGNAGNITAYWSGFREYHQAGKSTSLPKMMGWQAAGSAPIVDGHIIEHPETVATAIRIGNPASWQPALEAARDSGGKIDKVTDAEILHAYQLLAATEGIFVEPACAAPLAGLIKMTRTAPLPAGALVTATMTGHGLKDPDRAIRCAAQELNPIPPTLEAVLKAVGV